MLDSEKTDFIETRYLAEFICRSCEHASWRAERLLSKLDEGKSLNTSSTAAQLGEAREKPHRTLEEIERIEKLCELASRD